jgi:diphosphomevalonate decarboxylase
MMLSSRPGYSLLKEATMEIINRIRSYRDSTGTSVAFTLDAGPNLHLLYPTREKEKIRLWMNQQLKPLCEDGKMIHDFTGNGPQRLDR